MENIVIDVICPIYNGESYIDKLFNSVFRQKNILIRNFICPLTESNDKSLELLKCYPNIMIMNIKKNEFSHSLTREKAMSLCNANIVVMITQDIILSNDYVFYNLAKSISNEVVLAFSRQISKYDGIEKYIREFNYPEASYAYTINDIEKHQLKAFFCSDACQAYNRQVFNYLGGYDNKDLKTNEDMYYARKVLLNGYKLMYCSESVIYHSHKLKLKQLYARYYDLGVFFGQNKEFLEYKSNESGLKLAKHVLKRSFQELDIKSILYFFPNMIVRYLGKKNGQKRY